MGNMKQDAKEMEHDAGVNDNPAEHGAPERHRHPPSRRILRTLIAVSAGKK
jgi:hypothetical protein